MTFVRDLILSLFNKKQGNVIMIEHENKIALALSLVIILIISLALTYYFYFVKGGGNHLEDYYCSSGVTYVGKNNNGALLLVDGDVVYCYVEDDGSLVLFSKGSNNE